MSDLCSLPCCQGQASQSSRVVGFRLVSRQRCAPSFETWCFYSCSRHVAPCFEGSNFVLRVTPRVYLSICESSKPSKMPLHIASLCKTTLSERQRHRISSRLFYVLLVLLTVTVLLGDSCHVWTLCLVSWVTFAHEEGQVSRP